MERYGEEIEDDALADLIARPSQSGHGDTLPEPRPSMAAIACRVGDRRVAVPLRNIPCIRPDRPPDEPPIVMRFGRFIWPPEPTAVYGFTLRERIGWRVALMNLIGSLHDIIGDECPK